jgi:hypothetical protein
MLNLEEGRDSHSPYRVRSPMAFARSIPDFNNVTRAQNAAVGAQGAAFAAFNARSPKKAAKSASRARRFATKARKAARKVMMIFKPGRQPDTYRVNVAAQLAAREAEIAARLAEEIVERRMKADRAFANFVRAFNTVKRNSPTTKERRNIYKLAHPNKIKGVLLPRIQNIKNEPYVTSYLNNVYDYVQRL